MMKLHKIAAGAALLVASASPAMAQTVSFSTLGRFTSANAGCSNAVALLNATCTIGGFNLFFTGTSASNIGNNSVVSLGGFRLTGGGGNTVILPGDVTFELFVNQSSPSAGSASFGGSVQGSNALSFVYVPSPTSRSIGIARYQVILDDIGPAAGIGLALPENNDRGINALVNVVPEPSSVVLMGTGFAALVGMALRRRNA